MQVHLRKSSAFLMSRWQFLVHQWPWTVAVIFCAPVWAGHQEHAENKTILLLNPPKILSPSEQTIDRAMYEVFAKASHRSVILAEYVIIPQVEAQDELTSNAIALLEEKYRGQHINLIMARGEQALDFVERYGSQLWPDTPAMYFSISDTSINQHVPAISRNGVSFGHDFNGTLALIRRLQPSVRKIVQIVNTANEKEWQAMDAELKASAGPALQVETLPKMVLPTLLDHVSKLPDDTALLATAFSSNGETAPGSIGNFVQSLSTSASVPLYGMVEDIIGNGVVGGQAVDFAEHGRQAATIALQMLANRDAAKIAQVTSQSRCAVDTRQMERWQLRSSALDEDCERLFVASEFWDRHGTQVIAIAALVTTMLGTILVLLVSLRLQRRKRIQTDEETLRQRTALAHIARLGSVGELTASIVHEINQPLGAIMANTDAAAMMLSHQPSSDNELKAILKDIREDNLRASQIIQKLRTLLTKRSLESCPIAINDVIDTIKSLLGNLAIRHHASLQVRLGKNLPIIMGDSTHLQQVLINLAANAMEAMSQLPPPQRILTISTEVDPKGDVLLIVSDRGPGIPADTLPHIFESFYTTKPEGMGMGLAIVQTIIEAHHGHIEAFNNPQWGATFKVMLPAARMPDLQRQCFLQE